MEGVQKQWLGKLGEQLATLYLRRNGYEIVERNFKASKHEIDIVARDGTALVFVEVRSRSSDEFGSPLESVQREKKRHLVSAAAEYLAERGPLEGPFRFDVCGVLFRENEDPDIQLIQNAFYRGER